MTTLDMDERSLTGVLIIKLCMSINELSLWHVLSSWTKIINYLQSKKVNVLMRVIWIRD